MNKLHLLAVALLISSPVLADEAATMTPATTEPTIVTNAAEIADNVDLERGRAVNARPSSGPGLGYPVSPWVRREVMRLAARRERALGEEFLNRMKEQIDRDKDGAKLTHPTELGLFVPCDL